MAEVIRMPEVLAGAAEAGIQTWLVAPGTNVAIDQPLAEIETDKAIVEFAAEFAGTVGRILANEGDSVRVGDPILVLLKEGEGDQDIAAALKAAGAGGSTLAAEAPVETSAEIPEDTAKADSPPSEVVPESDVGTASSEHRLFASPLVRRLAGEAGVELASIQGTGPNGRIVRRDLERHLADLGGVPVPDDADRPNASQTAPTSSTHETETPEPMPPSSVDAAFDDFPLDRMRKTIARRLTESKSTVPHFYLVADCRVDALLDLRATVNESSARRISVNDFVIKAVARALLDVPAANAIWNEDSIRRYNTVDVAVAVATEGGLMTPVLRAVESASLSAVSETIAELAERARSGRLRQHELEGGSFSISNLGMYGTKQFSAILNPPQSGILAVGAARKEPVVATDGEVTTATIMTVTLSADHRVLDGAVAAEWLAAFQRRIENPLTILI